jgi:hypothetical protein
MHCSQKKPLNCAVLNGTIIFFPWIRREQGTKILFSPLFVTDFPPPDDFKKTLTQPTSNVLKGRWWGGSTVAAPAMSPSPVFAYKNRGKGRKGKKENRTREERDRGMREVNSGTREERGLKEKEK